MLQISPKETDPSLSLNHQHYNSLHGESQTLRLGNSSQASQMLIRVQSLLNVLTNQHTTAFSSKVQPRLQPRMPDLGFSQRVL